MKRWLYAVGLIAAMSTVGIGETSGAMPEDGGEAYGMYYGNGLRHFAEGRHGKAAEALFRAYGLEPSAHVMELIVDNYDQMGHCGAARRQQSFFERRYDESASPELERCNETGKLIVECGDVERSVTINDDIEGRCGEAVEVPAGQQHRVVDDEKGVRKRVVVEADARRDVSFEGDDTEAEVVMIPEAAGDVPRLPFQPRLTADVRRLPFELDDGPEVPRLTLPSDFDGGYYRIVQTSDGLYRIGTPEGEAGAEPQEGANVEIICPDDAPDGEKTPDCVWLRERSRDGDAGR